MKSVGFDHIRKKIIQKKTFASAFIFVTPEPVILQNAATEPEPRKRRRAKLIFNPFFIHNCGLYLNFI